MSTLGVGVLPHSFTGPSGDTCSGDTITFTCVVDSGSTTWRIIHGGNTDVCAYSRRTANEPETCGPENQFTSFQTREGSNIDNSSLSGKMANFLNETLIECLDGTMNTNNLMGSFTICLVGLY